MMNKYITFALATFLAIGMGRHGGVKETQYMQQAYKLGKNV